MNVQEIDQDIKLCREQKFLKNSALYSIYYNEYFVQSLHLADWYSSNFNIAKRGLGLVILSLVTKLVIYSTVFLIAWKNTHVSLLFLIWMPYFYGKQTPICDEVSTIHASLNLLEYRKYVTVCDLRLQQRVFVALCRQMLFWLLLKKYLN